MASENYDRLKELKEFDATKKGVKGLADSGATKIPRMFIRSPDDIAKDHPVADQNTAMGFSVPVIDLGLVNNGQRSDVVNSVRRAAESIGFFHVKNHGIPETVLKGMLNKTLEFHELPTEEKTKMYDRGMDKRVLFTSNFDLYKAKSANWRDTLKIVINKANPIDPLELHEICRDEVIEYSGYVERVSAHLFELLSEALGLDASYINDNFVTSELDQTHSCHYYPPCPEPELTQSVGKHTDPNFMTFLIKNHKEGLQVLRQNQWVDVSPIDGTILINIGDFLQILSNGKFMSCPHRVYAKKNESRLSVATFVGYNNIPRKLGPIKELLSENNRPLYKEVSGSEYMAYHFSKGIGHDVHALDHFRL